MPTKSRCSPVSFAKQLIDAVTSRSDVETEDLFKGNCGTFAVSLYRTLKLHGIDAGLIYVGNDEEEGISHAAIRVGKKILDGSGEISLKTLKEYGLFEHYSKLKDVRVFDYPPELVTENELWYVCARTDYDVSEAEFLEIFQQEATGLTSTINH